MRGKSMGKKVSEQDSVASKAMCVVQVYSYSSVIRNVIRSS